MGIFGMSDEEKKKISDQHKKLEKETRDKREQLKQGLTKPEEKKENKKTS
jgi:hypothetical protein